MSSEYYFGPAGGAKNAGASGRARIASIKKPGRSPDRSEGGSIRVHSRQSTSNSFAPPRGVPGGVSGALQRPLAAKPAAISAVFAALNRALPFAFCQRSQRVPPSSRVAPRG